MVLTYVALAVIALVLQRTSLPMPRWLAVHLLLLGAVTNAIVTWTEHFAVALLRASAPPRSVAAMRLVALNLAVVGVLVGVVADLPTITMAAAALLAVVVLAHLTALVRMSRHALMNRFAGTIGFYVLAGVALVAGIVLGTVVSLADLSEPAHEQLHAAHVHANVLGWVGLTVLGTLFTLWPTVLRTRIARWALDAELSKMTSYPAGGAVEPRTTRDTGSSSERGWMRVTGVPGSSSEVCSR